ncbi:hypothetical protein ASD32_04415 [Rhizobium sp. Root483D2]|nr:hypothetical protein ASD32_04415 [Rhizobium sp. Root483D2]
MLQSNGYGTLHPRIVVSVAASDAEEAERRLRTPISETVGEPPRARFEVKTSARRQGDDETAVWQIGALLDVSAQSLDWYIEWEASVY